MYINTIVYWHFSSYACTCLRNIPILHFSSYTCGKKHESDIHCAFYIFMSRCIDDANNTFPIIFTKTIILKFFEKYCYDIF